jgi:hypothetical protein
MFDDIFTEGPVMMWRIEKGVNRFRFQTSDRIAIRRMRQREKFTLFAEQINGPLRIFDTELYDLKSAKRALKAIAAPLSIAQDSEAKKTSPPKRNRGKKVHIST